MLTREYYRVMAEWDWNPRVVETLKVSELLNAYFMIPILRKDRIRETASAISIGMTVLGQKGAFKQAMDSLEN